MKDVNETEVPKKAARKTYELTIPEWQAAIPRDWPLEIGNGSSFRSVSGSKIHIKAGTKLRGGPESLLQGMLGQGFVKEV